MKPRYDSDLLRGNTESILLFLIKEQPNGYGYQLIRETEKRSGGFFQPSVPSRSAGTPDQPGVR